MRAAATIIEAQTRASQYWRDLWTYRELVRILAWRDLAVRYRQAAFGVLWALGRPILTAAVFSLVFGVIAGLPAGGTPYVLLVLTGLLVWQLFAGAVQDAAQSLVANAALVTKVYFPRALAPAAAAVVSLADAAISLALLLGLSLFYGISPGIVGLMWFVPVLLVTLVLSFGVGLWLSALNVKYRDVRIVLPFALQIGIYLSPVGFSSHVVPEHWRTLFVLNPLVGLIEGARAALLGTLPPSPLAVTASVVWAFLAVVSGVWYFRSTERFFADVI